MVRRLKFPTMAWGEAPLLPAALAFICGLLLDKWRNYPGSEVCSITVTALCWAVALPLQRWRVARLAILAGFLAAGMAIAGLSRLEAADRSLRPLIECGALDEEEPIEMWGEVSAVPEPAPDRMIIEIEAERAVSLRREYRIRARVRLVVPFGDGLSRLEYDSLGIDYGARVRVPAYLLVRKRFNNPGAPPFDQILEAQGIAATGWVKSPLLIEVTGRGGGNPLIAILGAIRHRAIVTILREVRQPAAGLLAASLFGNQHFLSREAAEPFRAGGTFHLLVISGMHMAMIAVVILWLLERVTSSRGWRYGGGLLLVWSYAVMVGAQPSVARSVVMLTLALAGRFLFRSIGGANSLAGATLLLLTWQPRDLFNPGFQISFLTVAAIVALTGPLTERVRAIGRWRPTALTPWPPHSPPVVRFLAETLFWDEWRFRQEMRRERVRYRLIKARPALWLSRWRLQPAIVWITLTIVTTIGVQVALLPVMVSDFHRVSLLSPLINVVEGVLVALLMGLGAVHLLLCPLIGGWTRAIVPAIERLGDFAVRAGAEMAAWPGGGWRVPDPGPQALWLNGAWCLAVLTLVLLLDRWNPLSRGDGPGEARRSRLATLVTLLATATVAVVGWRLLDPPALHRYQPGTLRLTFLDVGQGDAIFISFPRGRTMLVDAGGDQQTRREDYSHEAEPPFIEDRIGIAEAVTMPFLWHLGVRRLDYVVASHGDNDHAGGFDQILESFAIGEAWLHPGLSGPFLDRVAAAATPVRRVSAGERLELDGVTVEALSAGGASFSDNNGSLVLRLVYRGRAILLTGDIEQEAEAALVTAGLDLRADVLKVAHHGSRTSSSAEFLRSVGAGYAVISAGRGNSYGHPHPEVVARLRRMGMVVVETSRLGAVTCSVSEAGEVGCAPAVAIAPIG